MSKLLTEAGVNFMFQLEKVNYIYALMQLTHMNYMKNWRRRITWAIGAGELHEQLAQANYMHNWLRWNYMNSWRRRIIFNICRISGWTSSCWWTVWRRGNSWFCTWWRLPSRRRRPGSRTSLRLRLSFPTHVLKQQSYFGKYFCCSLLVFKINIKTILKIFKKEKFKYPIKYE